MNRSICRATILFPLLWHAGADCSRAQQVGDLVFAIQDVELTEGSRVVGTFHFGQYSRIQAIDGDLFWIEPSARGFVKREDVKTLEPALEFFTTLVGLDPTNDNAYFGRGNVFYNKREFDKAIADQTEAIRLNPKKASYFNNRGLNWEAKGDYGKAIADYGESLRLSPSFMSYNNRGRAWRHKGDYDQSIADYDESIKLAPKYSPAHQGRGIVLELKGEYERAIADFNAALRLNPKSALAYGSLAFLQATCPDDRFRDGAKALANAQQARELSSPKDGGSLDTLAVAYAESGDFEKARQSEEQAIALANSERDKKNYLARLELFKAQKPYRQELKKKPASP